LFGSCAFYYAFKSKRALLNSRNDIEKAIRFKKTAQQLIIAGLLVTLLFLIVPYFLYVYQNELFQLINRPLINSTNLTSTSTTSTTTTRRLMYNSTRIVKTLISRTITTGKPIILRSYDKLNILIDHDLFKSLKVNTDLFQRLKITNQTLILN
jgi:hypothetical protein